MKHKLYQRGLIPIAIVMFVALSVVLGTIVYRYATDRAPGGMSEQEVQVLLQFFETQMLLTDSEEEQMAISQEALETLARYVKQQTSLIVTKDHCEATMQDIFRAVMLAEQAIKAGLEEERVALLDWARISFRSLIPQMALATGPTHVDLGEEYDDTDREDLNKLKEGIFDAKGIYAERIKLGNLSDLLGLEGLSSDIQNGKYIQPLCIQLWDVGLTATYVQDWDDLMYEHWKQIVTIKDVPIYKYDPELELPYMSREYSERAKFISAQGATWDGGKWEAHTYPDGSVWEVQLAELSHTNLWSYKIKLRLYPHMSYLAARAENGYGNNIALEMFGNTIYEIPMYDFWKGESFSVNSDDLVGDDGTTGKLQVVFTPKGMVSVEKLRELMYN